MTATKKTTARKSTRKTTRPTDEATAEMTWGREWDSHSEHNGLNRELDIDLTRHDDEAPVIHHKR